MIATTPAPVTTAEAEEITVCLTPRGEATRLVYRLSRAVAGLSPEDRSAVLCLLGQLLPSA